MNHALDGQITHQAAHDIGVDVGRGQQDILDRAIRARHEIIRPQPAFVQNLADQRIAVGVHSGRRQTDEHIAYADTGPVYDLGIVRHPHAKARKIIFAFAVHIRHFSCFAAEQRAACLLAAFGNARDHLRGLFHIQLSRGEIVKEKQRARALNQNIIGTHGDKIDTHGIMLVESEGELQFRAHPVRGSDQNGLVHTGHIRLEKAAEPADIRQDAVDMRLGHDGFNP